MSVCESNFYIISLNHCNKTQYLYKLENYFKFDIYMCFLL